MANRKSPGKGASARRRRREDTATPALPAWKAFVVQFTSETGVEAKTFCGRAEHLSTGQRSRFESVQELVEFVHAVLQDPGLNRR
jgi:hypothetical protein